MRRLAGTLALWVAAFDFASGAEPLVGVDQVALGWTHACALSAGKVACWGANAEGQLGNGTRAASNVARAVVGLPGPATSVAAGRYATCAAIGGEAYCWGREEGTLPTQNTLPVSIAGLEGVVALAVGERHTCALDAGGGVQCWGANDRGQLGNAGTRPSTDPVPVSGLGSGVVAIAAGDMHACALMAGGAVKCWGAGTLGELGDGASLDSPVPVGVSGLGSSVAGLDAGAGHTCAVTGAGQAWCWGVNGYRQLGNGSTVSTSPVPVPVEGLATGVEAISGGVLHTCARTPAGAVLCWGSNDRGQIGNDVHAGGQVINPIPTPVAGLAPGTTSIAAGYFGTCAIVAPTGSLHCWGDNREGGVGAGTVSISPSAVESKTPPPVNEVATGGVTSCGYVAGVPICGVSAAAHSCAVAGGGVLCWGANHAGQLGNGSMLRSLVPIPVPSLSSGIVAVATGGEHSCALSAAGALACWGGNAFGQLGDGTNITRTVPRGVIGLESGVIAVSAGPAHTCALTSAGAALCWGANHNGQLGDGSSMHASLPQQVTGLGSGVLRVSAGGLLPTSQSGGGFSWSPLGGGFSCAVTIAGSAKCWGANDVGQLGSNAVSSSTPVDVAGLVGGVIDVSTGGAHACAMLLGSGVKCWGWNHVDQVGLPSSVVGVAPPTELPWIVPGVVAVAAGDMHTCVATLDGVVRCWGGGRDGELLADETEASEDARLVEGLPVPAFKLAAGSAHTCAIGVDQRVRCWGNNEQGPLGDGGAAILATPQAVVQTPICNMFDDLPAASSFCANVIWLANRSITLGCEQGLYCPASSVSRLSMAAFMNRLGGGLAPAVAVAQQERTSLDVDSHHLLCSVSLPEAGDQPQSLQIDTVVSIFTSADRAIGVSLTWQSGSFWRAISEPVPVSTVAGRWTQVRQLGSVDVPLGAGFVSVGFYNAAIDPVQVDRVTCNLRVRIDNRNDTPP